MHQDTAILKIDSTLDYKATTWRSSLFNHETTSPEATTLKPTTMVTSATFESTSKAAVKTRYVPETTAMDKTTAVNMKTSDYPYSSVFSTTNGRWRKGSTADSITSSSVDYLSEKHNEPARSTVKDTGHLSEYISSSIMPRKSMSTYLEQMTTNLHDRMSTKSLSYRRHTGLHQYNTGKKIKYMYV